MPINTQQRVLELLTSARCYPVQFPVIVEKMRMSGLPLPVPRVWINAIARVDAGPSLFFRCAVTGQSIARGRPHEAILAVACPDLPELSDNTVEHCYLFIVKNRINNDPIFFVTTDGLELFSPYGSTFEHANPLTAKLSTWFDASLALLSDQPTVEHPEEPGPK